MGSYPGGVFVSFESSNATAINGDQSNNVLPGSGAVYVFVRSGGSWSQQAYLKTSNAGMEDLFGHSAAISGDTVVVGAPLEEQVERVLELFNDRTLDLDSAAADKLAQIAANCEKNGQRALAPAAYIAACAAARGFSVATRNVNHFPHLGVRVIDRWR